MDHGLEKPDARRAAGKPDQGTISLVLREHQDHVALHLSDDGRGLALDVLHRKGVEAGVLPGDGPVSDEAIAQVIFHGGLSTVEKVTDISGRGVGMDAVKQFLRESGGDIHIAFTGLRQANGFRNFEFVLRLPWTLLVAPVKAEAPVKGVSLIG